MSATASPVLSRPWIDKFKSNLRFAGHYATDYVNPIWALLFARWASLGETRQMELVGNVLPLWAVPPAMFVSWIVSHFMAKGWPQPRLEQKILTSNAAQDSLKENENSP